jgi:hypothetical protein
LLEAAEVLGTLEVERLIESQRELVPLDEVSWSPLDAGLFDVLNTVSLLLTRPPLQEARRGRVGDAFFEPNFAAGPHAERSMGPTRASSGRRPRRAPS